VAVPPVWSTRVAAVRQDTSAVWTALYTVPSGKVLIVRRIQVVNLSGSTANMIIGLNHDFQQFLLNAVPNSSSVDVDTWMVYEAGEEVSIYSDHATIEVSVHGQLLTAP
jgi:hypothetical protein